MGFENSFPLLRFTGFCRVLALEAVLMTVKEEYDRIYALFAKMDENQLSLLGGAILEAARLKVELDGLHKIVRQTGLIKINPDNPEQQKELPVSRMIVKVRANYLNYIAKLNSILGGGMDEEEDEALGEYE